MDIDRRTFEYLSRIPLHQFTAGWPRQRSIGIGARECAALPAYGFTGWCRRRAGHDGDHSAVAATAARMDGAARGAAE